MIRTQHLAAALTLVFALGGTLAAQTVQRDEVKLVNLAPSPLTVNTAFGCSVDVSVDTVVVGAPRDGFRGTNAGVAMVYQAQNGVLGDPVILSASDAQEYDFFGTTVAIDGDWIIVGAQGTGQQGKLTGRAYVFERSGETWTEQGMFEADMPMEYDLFGHAVAVSGSRFVVGARWKDDQGRDSGAAYVFERAPNGSFVREQIIGSDTTVGDMFGEAVAIDGDTIAVGAWSADPQGFNSGAVYIFKHDGQSWAQEAKLSASDGEPFNNFGVAVDLSGDLLLVGAEGDDDLGLDSGSAYIFARNGASWSEEQKLLAGDGIGGDLFGQVVALDSGWAYVGAPGYDSALIDGGAIYRFGLQVSTWIEDSKKTGEENLGHALAADSTIVVSADYSGFGSVRVFDGLAAAWPQTAEIQATSPGGAGANFGAHVALAGEMLLAGDPDAMIGQERGLIQLQAKHNPSLAQQIISTPPGRGVIGGELAVDGSLMVATSGSGLTGAWLFERRGGGYVLLRDLSTVTPLQLWSGIDSSVAISDRRFVVSFPIATIRGVVQSGVVVVYERDSLFGWQPSRFISRAVPGEQMGNALAMHKRFLVTAVSGPSGGVHLYDQLRFSETYLPGTPVDALAMTAGIFVAGSPSAGEAYVFELQADAWSLMATLSVPAGSADRFGSSVAISEDQILVGAPEDDEVDFDRGAVYVFEKLAGAWTEVEKIHPSDAHSEDLFGSSLAINAGVWAVGAPSRSGPGAVYLFTDPLHELSFGDGCGGEFGVPLLLPLAGEVPSIGTTFDMELTGLPPASLTIGLLGFSRTNMLGLELPYALGSLAPGCLVHGSGELRTVLNNSIGSANWTIDIPDNPNLIGLRVYLQGISIDTEANLIGWVLSNGLQPRMTN